MTHLMKLPRAGQIWQHYKGDHYRVFGLGFDTKTGDAAVIYQLFAKIQTYPAGGQTLTNQWQHVDLHVQQVWVRPLGEFLGFTEDHSRRFTLVPSPVPERETV